MHIRRTFFCCAWIASIVAASGARAQQADTPGEGIVVTGKREIPPKVARRYVRQISSTVDGQFARFAQPVCPRVTGFAPQYNAVMERRIRKVAGDAGARVAREGCSPNLIVLLTKGADAVVNGLRDKQPGLFEGVDRMDLHRVFRPGPVHLWNSTMLLNEDGQRQSGATMTVKSASILNRATQQAIVGSTVVIDSDAALGKSLYQLADYVTMRALVGAKPPAQGVDADTILTLFDPRITPPPRLTMVDRSYLAAVYDTPPTSESTRAMGRISGKIVRDAETRVQGKD